MSKDRPHNSPPHGAKIDTAVNGGEHADGGGEELAASRRRRGHHRPIHQPTLEQKLNARLKEKLTDDPVIAETFQWICQSEGAYRDGRAHADTGGKAGTYTIEPGLTFFNGGAVAAGYTAYFKAVGAGNPRDYLPVEAGGQGKHLSKAQSYLIAVMYLEDDTRKLENIFPNYRELPPEVRHVVHDFAYQAGTGGFFGQSPSRLVNKTSQEFAARINAWDFDGAAQLLGSRSMNWVNSVAANTGSENKRDWNKLHPRATRNIAALHHAATEMAAEDQRRNVIAETTVTAEANAPLQVSDIPVMPAMDADARQAKTADPIAVFQKAMEEAARVSEAPDEGPKTISYAETGQLTPPPTPRGGGHARPRRAVISHS